MDLINNKGVFSHTGENQYKSSRQAIDAMHKNKQRIFDILETARQQQVTGYRQQMTTIVGSDKKVTNMPPIRINANRTMHKYRMKQEEIEV